MTKTKGTGSVKRFGARYGRSVKNKIAILEKESKPDQLCPYCKNKKAKRIAFGIFSCKKCNAKFTSKAYIVDPKMKVKAFSAYEKQEGE